MKPRCLEIHINDLIARGVLRVYGKGFDTNDLIITYNATNTFATNIVSTNLILVTAVPLGTLSQIYFQPLLGPNPTPRVWGQSSRRCWRAINWQSPVYSAVTGVVLSSPEPGFDLNGTPPTLFVE